MKEDMLEILIYLFENYMIDGNSFEPGQVELAKELVGAGFSDGEVDKAFIWLEDLLDANHQDSGWQSRSSNSMRFYTSIEAECLTLEGQALLIRLVSAGLLNQRSHETVIDRVMALDSSDITFDHIKWVVLMVLSNQSDFSEIADWAEALVGEDLAPVIH